MLDKTEIAHRVVKGRFTVHQQQDTLMRPLLRKQRVHYFYRFAKASFAGASRQSEDGRQLITIEYEVTVLEKLRKQKHLQKNA